MPHGWKVKDPQKFIDNLVTGLHGFGDQVFTESQRNVPVDEGTLKKSGVIVKSSTGFKILYRTSYAWRQEKGVEPGTTETVKKHMVKAHTRKTSNTPKKVGISGNLSVRLTPVTLVQEHERGPFERTYEEGIAGKHYVGNAFEKYRPKLAAFITKLYGRAR